MFIVLCISGGIKGASLRIYMFIVLCISGGIKRASCCKGKKHLRYMPLDINVGEKNRMFAQGAFHVVNPEDLRREVELLLGVAAYSLLPWHGGTTLFCFTQRKCLHDGVIYNY